MLKHLFILCLALTGCRQNSRWLENESAPKADAGINQDSIRIDSIRISNFLAVHPLNNPEQQSGLIAFYRSRNNRPAWMNETGLYEQSGSFINLLEQDISQNTKTGDCFINELHSLYKDVTENGKAVTTEKKVNLDLLLTTDFFKYANSHWMKPDKKSLNQYGWMIEMKRMTYESLLDSVLQTNNVLHFDPVYRQYALLKKQLEIYKRLDSLITPFNIPYKVYHVGDSSSDIANIKTLLEEYGDLPHINHKFIYDEELTTALKSFQKRMGLPENGIPDNATLLQLNIPVCERIQQILINMERCKWVPAEINGNYLAVNIPAFKLYVYSGDSVLWSSNVIVGKTNPLNNTVIFNDEVEDIVFSPYWVIPENILLKEILPEIRKDSTYIKRNSLEVLDQQDRVMNPTTIQWQRYQEHFPYIIRQTPGINNALGLVKFLFPNPYDIYMHDTPEKSLFEKTTRTFSHGCIRIEKPFELAQFLLRNDTAWNDEKILDAMYAGEEKFVKLKTKVPIFIAYFTAWVDHSGRLNFRKDVYGHDTKMKELLFSE